APAPAQAPAPVAETAAPAGEQSIRERFQQQAYARLGANSREEFENMDPRQRNTMITGEYANMYMAHEDTMKWAGMAAYASDLVGVGIAATDVAGAIPGLPAGMNLAGVDNERLRAALARGNAGVYDDLMWQHMAMESGGIEMIRKAAEAG